MQSFYEKYWKTTPCFLGEGKCWCHMIVTVDYEDTTDDENIVIGSGTLNHEMATYLTVLHNDALTKRNR